jgi:hypothetical protein
LIVEFPQRLEACWSLIKGNPSITRHVRELQLLRMTSYTPADAETSGCLDDIIEALAATPQPPSSLKLTGWVGSPASFQSWMAASFFSTTLTSLDLSHIMNISLSTIWCLRNLRFLNFYMADMADMEEPATPLQRAGAPPPPGLESLTYQLSANAVRLLVEASRPDFQYAILAKLRVLRFHSHGMPEMALLRDLINTTSSALEVLEIHQYYRYLDSTHLLFCFLESTIDS